MNLPQLDKLYEKIIKTDEALNKQGLTQSEEDLIREEQEAYIIQVQYLLNFQNAGKK